MHLIKQRVASALDEGGAPVATGIMLVADLLPFCPTQPGANYTCTISLLESRVKLSKGLLMSRTT
eukprot:scaffold1800_cov237-Pinguiococcus_pyrenoidosus.AAC.5